MLFYAYVELHQVRILVVYKKYTLPFKPIHLSFLVHQPSIDYDRSRASNDFNVVVFDSLHLAIDLQKKTKNIPSLHIVHEISKLNETVKKDGQ